MVCPRCIAAVKQKLEELHIPYASVKLGEVEVLTDDIDYKQLNKELKSIGFELLTDKDRQITEQIKVLVIEYVHYTPQMLKVNFSDFLSDKLHTDYFTLSRIFSKTEGTTIEKYLIRQKIERVKELISYGELNFSEIAWQLQYSSPAHLSQQFKKITGMTLTQYKNSPENKRKALNEI